MMFRGFDDRLPVAGADASASARRITGRAAIASTMRLVEALEQFQRDPDLRLLPVLDEVNRPLGALYERDIRRLVFNPFGHALLKNPSYGGRLMHHVLPCPVVEAGTGIESLIEAFARAGAGCEGLIVTRGGRFEGVIDGRVLIGLAAERDAGLARDRAQRLALVDTASAAFETEATDLASELARVAETLSRTAERTMTRAGQAGVRSAEAAEAAADAEANIAEIGARTRELVATVQQVEARMDEAVGATRSAVELVEAGGADMAALAQAAQEIDDVTAAIDEISRQVTMLALNATIEASRAGDAGRGFAVVAGEIKGLALQSARAAGGIASRVGNMRGAITRVSDGHGGIVRAIGAIDSLSGSIAAASREQGSATRAIAANLEDAHRSTSAIRAGTADIRTRTTAAAEDAAEIRLQSDALSHRAATLNQRVAEFLRVVQPA